MKRSVKSKVLFVLSLLFGLFFINAGLNKFFNYMPMPQNLPEKMQRAFAAFTEIGWLMPLVGLAEIVGGIFIIFKRTRALGALVVFPVMVGILMTNIVQDRSGLGLSLVFLAILLWIMYEDRAKYLQLLSRSETPYV